MGYRIGKVNFRNFGPFAEGTINLDQPGVTLIEGSIHGIPGCDSNGAGKSFIFDGIAWALYGRCIRPEYTGDDVVKLKARGGCEVSVELTRGHEPVLIRRYRNDPQYRNQVHLSVGGQDVTRGTNAETQIAIERVIGMDYLTFCNTVAFGVREDVKSFFTATDTDRKKVLDMMLGLEVYGEAEKVARRRMKEAALELENRRSKVGAVLIRIEEKKETIQMLEQAREDDTASKLKEFKKTLKSATVKHTEWVGKVQKMEEKIEGLREKLEAEESDYFNAIKAHQAKLVEMEREEVRIDNEVLAARIIVQGVEKRLTAMVDLSGVECPTCHQTVTDKHVKGINKGAKAELAEAKKKFDAATTALSDYQTKLADARETQPERSARAIELEEEIAALDERLDTRCETRDKWKSAARTAERLIEEAEEAQGRSTDRVDKAKKELAEMEESIEEGRVVIEQQEEIVATLEFWVQAFGNQGLKSFLIEAEIPEVNRHATRYARRLLGEGAKVQLKATTTLKSGANREKLTVEGVIPGKTNKYPGASKGQKKRMDLSLLLAFRKLIAGRVQQPFDQLFADEIFDGLDQSGVEVIGELLREEAASGPVALVTHDPRVKPVGDRFVLIEHDGVSACIGTTGASAPESPAPKKKVGRTVKVRKVKAQ